MRTQDGRELDQIQCKGFAFRHLNVFRPAKALKLSLRTRDFRDSVFIIGSQGNALVSVIDVPDKNSKLSSL